MSRSTDHEELLRAALSELAESAPTGEEILLRLRETTPSPTPVRPFPRRYPASLASAAALAIVAGGGWFVSSAVNRHENRVTLPAPTSAQAVGGRFAVTVADGRAVKDQTCSTVRTATGVQVIAVTDQCSTAVADPANEIGAAQPDRVIGGHRIYIVAIKPGDGGPGVAVLVPDLDIRFVIRSEDSVVARAIADTIHLAG